MGGVSAKLSYSMVKVLKLGTLLFKIRGFDFIT